MSITTGNDVDWDIELVSIEKNQVLTVNDKQFNKTEFGVNSLDILKFIAKVKVDFNISFSEEAFVDLKMTKLQDLTRLYNVIKRVSNNLFSVFSDKQFYKGFPFEVEDIDDVSLYFNAFLHYVGITDKPLLNSSKDYSDKFFNPTILEKLKRKPILTIKKIENLSSARNLLLDTLTYSAVPLNDKDRENLAMCINSDVVGATRWFDSKENKEIPIRANRVIFVGEIINTCKNVESVSFVLRNIKNSLITTATDVLRLAYYLGTLDNLTDIKKGTSLKLSTKEKKSLFMLLASLSKLNEKDFIRYEEQWKLLDRVSQIKKPQKFVNMINSLYAKELKSWDSLYNKALEEKNLEELNKLSMEDPSSFIRRFIETLCANSWDDNAISFIFDMLKDRIKSCPTKIIVSLYNRMINVGRSDYRLVSVMGTSMLLTENSRLSDKIYKQLNPALLIVSFELIQRIKSGISKYVSKNHFDGLSNPEDSSLLENSKVTLAIPSSLRETNNHYNFVTPYSRIKIADDQKFIRLLTYWENTPIKDIDVDLSAIFYKDDFSEDEDSYIAYTNLRNRFAAHSGDIVDAPNGAVEAIDIDLDRMKNAGYRYACMTTMVYSGDTFNKLNTVSAGYLTYKDKEHTPSISDKVSSQIFQVNSNSYNAINLIFDLETREIIIVDRSRKSSYVSPTGLNQVSGDRDSLSDSVKQAVLYKPLVLSSELLKGTYLPDDNVTKIGVLNSILNS